MVSTYTCILNTSSDKFTTHRGAHRALHRVTCAFTESYNSHKTHETKILRGTSGALLSPSWGPACDWIIAFAWMQEASQTCNWGKILLWYMTNWWVTSMGLNLDHELFFCLYIWFIIHSCILFDDFVGICQSIYPLLIAACLDWLQFTSLKSLSSKIWLTHVRPLAHTDYAH